MRAIGAETFSGFRGLRGGILAGRNFGNALVHLS